MPDPKRPDDRRLPRDAAGSLELAGGTGGITAMCSCDEFLEVYKEDMTFRVKSPESVDPGRTNPNAPFVAAVAASRSTALFPLSGFFAVLDRDSGFGQPFFKRSSPPG